MSDAVLSKDGSHYLLTPYAVLILLGHSTRDPDCPDSGQERAAKAISCVMQSAQRAGISEVAWIEEALLKRELTSGEKMKCRRIVDKMGSKRFFNAIEKTGFKLGNKS